MLCPVLDGSTCFRSMADVVRVEEYVESTSAHQVVKLQRCGARLDPAIADEDTPPTPQQTEALQQRPRKLRESGIAGAPPQGIRMGKYVGHARCEIIGNANNRNDRRTCTHELARQVHIYLLRCAEVCSNKRHMPITFTHFVRSTDPDFVAYRKAKFLCQSCERCRTLRDLPATECPEFQSRRRSTRALPMCQPGSASVLRANLDRVFHPRIEVFLDGRVDRLAVDSRRIMQRNDLSQRLAVSPPRLTVSQSLPDTGSLPSSAPISRTFDARQLSASK
ncbi:hypothetical protein J2793_005147 [Paraburkholderia caledonica]|uniref:Uncharacterized protein n=1 Tax=Paraburkholderia caledonica TaxID=134536 RepID=A0AB73II14_9BURK|nr:hypothetical protein [Paraburkholderia caledonica]